MQSNPATYKPVSKRAIDTSEFALGTDDDEILARAMIAPDFGRLGEARLMSLEDFLVSEVGEEGVFVISVPLVGSGRVYLQYQVAGVTFLKPKAFVKDEPGQYAPEEVMGMAMIRWEDLSNS